MPVTLFSPPEVSKTLALRLRARRLDRGWTQAELAERSNVAVDTLKKFERTGQISLVRMVRLTMALGCVDEVEHLFRQSVPASLDALEQPERQRGRSSRQSRGA